MWERGELRSEANETEKSVDIVGECSEAAAEVSGSADTANVVTADVHESAEDVSVFYQLLKRSSVIMNEERLLFCRGN